MFKSKNLHAKKGLVFLLGLLVLVWFVPGQKQDVYKRPLQQERSRDFDVLHYRIQLSFDLDKKTFNGENQVTLTAFKNKLQECRLDAEELIVSAAFDSKSQPLTFQQTNRHVIVTLAEPINFGEKVTFTLKYHGKDPKYGLFFDDESPERPQVVTTVSWPEYAHHWIPCYDFPHDKVTHDMIITVKADLKVLSNGKLVKVVENEKQGTTTYFWSQELPHPMYLCMLAIGPYAVIQDSFGDLPVNYWVYPQDEENARRIFKKTPYMIDFFNQLYGYEYPWAKYDQVVSPRQGGGAEATSATVLGEGVIYDKRAEQDFSWERIIAHELAHQWWGDLITLRTWSHTWLNESFGTYSDYLYTRYDMGEDEGALALLGKKNSYLREAHTRYIRPIVFDRYERPQQNFDSHTYPKGAVVLHMLRFILGDDPFFKTLEHFLHKHAFQAVDTHDFMTAVKEATGQNMDWFFEQYIFKPGHPIFDLSYQWDENDKQVNLRITQKQDTSLGVPIYKIPVIISIITPGKKKAEKIWITQQDEVFAFPVTERPLLVRFDEGNFLLKEWTFEKSQAELLYQLGHDDVIGRMWAAEELAKFKRNPHIVEALMKSAAQDGYWSVRQSAVNSLGKLKTEKQLDFFKEKCLDANSKVRVSALQILGEYQNPALAELFVERFHQDDSYLAQAQALRSLGKCGNRSHLQLLEHAASLKSPRNVLYRAAQDALKAIKEQK